MTKNPRAIRSIAALLALWVAGRVFVNMPVAVEAVEPDIMAQATPQMEFGYFARGSSVRVPLTDERYGVDIPFRGRTLRIALDESPSSVQDVEPRFAMAEADTPKEGAPAMLQPSMARETSVGTNPGRAAIGKTLGSLKASAWAFYRAGGRSSSLAPSGQLGGSQAGARLWAGLANVGSNGSLGASLRVSSALAKGAQREVAPGVSLRLGGRLPVEIIAERRFSIGGGGKDRFALLAATGIDDVALPQKLLLSGYAQAGVAGLRKRDKFVDGAARVERKLEGVAEPLDLRVGANLWGGAQPGASRLDAGPSLSVRTGSLGVPLRLSAEWRQRVAGKSEPGSGPAISVGADF